MPVIIISGMPVTGSSSTAKLLAERLGLRHFSAGDFFKSFSFAKGETEKATDFWKTRKANTKAFHASLEKNVRDECRKGDVVIDSKLGIRMQKGHYDFSVWLTAPFPVRVERVQERDMVKGEDAEALLKEKERLEREKYMKIYGFNLYSQDKEADLVIDNSSLSKKGVVDRIVKELKKRKIIQS